MHLHLTIFGKLIDSIAITPSQRSSRQEIEQMKRVLRERNIELLRVCNTDGEFYLDPYLPETTTEQMITCMGGK